MPTEQKFLQKIGSRMPPAQAFQQLSAIQVAVLMKLLVKKGVFTQEELAKETVENCDQVSELIMNAPVAYPLTQNRP